MTTIDIDVIALIIDNVDDRETLFSLLTVSKEVFRYTCRALYNDPFRFFRDNDLPGDTIRRSASRLMKLLLVLSPAADDDANLVRRAFSVPPKHKSESINSPTTMVDYLSFIQCIRWEAVADHLPAILDGAVFQDWEPTPGRWQERNSFVGSTVTWCLCGHQLGQIRELEIEPATIEDYIAIAPQLGRLRTLHIAEFNVYAPDPEALKRIYTAVARLILALQKYHGRNQVRDCYTSFAEDHKLDAYHWEFEIQKLLPHILPQDLKLAMPLRPMDSYLSRRTHLQTDRTYDRWDDISKEYSDMAVGQLLQRCRALRRLDLDFTKGRIDDDSVLAWAADEARKRAAGQLQARAVQLDELQLLLTLQSSSFAHRVLMDGLRGFSASLRHLAVDARRQDGNIEEAEKDTSLPSMSILRDESVVMRRLKSVEFMTTDLKLFDGHILLICPNLTNLKVSMEHYEDESCALPPSWPVANLSCLTTLTLCGPAVALFDPASLHSMPKLQDMRCAIDSRVEYLCASGGTWTDRWTWDWNLPELKKIIMQISLSGLKFSFKVLRGCPKLQELMFEFPDSCEVPPYPLDVLSVLTAPDQDIFPNLETLTLTGKISIQPEDLKFLMGHSLPRLQKFHAHTVAPCTTHQVVEFSRDHPSLTSVMLLNTPLERSVQQELGFVSEFDRSVDVGRCAYMFDLFGPTWGTYRLRQSQ